MRTLHKTLRYWQKLYIAVLLLFLACLYGGLFGVAQISCRASFQARVEEFLSRQRLASQSLAEDMTAVLSRRPDALADLFTTHIERYGREGLRIAIGFEDRTLQDGGVPPYASQLPTPQPGSRSWRVIQGEDGQHRIYAVTAFDGGLTGYWAVACASMEDFYAQWQRMSALFVGLVSAVSVLFAVGLYAVLRGMNRPLRQLTDAAQAMAAGDYAVRAGQGRPRRDELGDLARTLDELAAKVSAQLAQLESEAAAKQTLVDDLSHEMRTPLTAIGGYAEYIQRADLSGDELMDATETIAFESRRLLNLSNQLVRLSVLNHEPLERETVDLPELLDCVFRAAAPKAGRRGVRLILQPVPPGLTVEGQPDLLESLFVNLCDNGIKACGTEEDGVRGQGEAPDAPRQVTLAALPLEDGVQVTVTDTGHGMDAGTLANLGRPFYRADKARSRAEGGAGLGLTICFAIVEAHGASLHFTSAPGRGTTAAVTFGGAPAKPELE